jgi:uncharacterized SAM-binding protein YcdF (DUF218 family)
MIARALAFFLGAFSLLNVLGDLAEPGFDVNLWWIDLRALPHALADVLLATAGGLMILWAIRPHLGMALRIAVAGATAGLLGAAVGNAIHFYVLLARGLKAGMPLPLSLFIAAALVAVLRAIYRTISTGPAIPTSPASCGLDLPSSPKPARRRWRSAAWALVTLAACALLLPLLQMVCFGRTDYRRPADAIVVFGAGVYADGKPSDALIDRVATACELYKQGLAGVLIFSGGPGQGSVHETQAMRDLAIQRGVPPDAVVLDPAGFNTEATIANTMEILRSRGLHDVLAVSHAYHLPRVKMCFARHGQEVYTVPAKETYFLSFMPYYMAREVAAVWSYYLRPLLSVSAREEVREVQPQK